MYSNERQMFLQLKNFFVEFETKELVHVYNSAKNKTLEHIFIRAADILFDNSLLNALNLQLLYM